MAVSYTHLDVYKRQPQTGQGHLRRRAAVSGLLGADGFLKRQAPDPIPDGYLLYTSRPR